LSQNNSITLISQDQRGFLLYLMVNQGRPDPKRHTFDYLDCRSITSACTTNRANFGTFLYFVVYRSF
jgi:hypothetical protein